jgi:hypothetical protein
MEASLGQRKLPSPQSKLPSGQIPIHCAREADIVTMEASPGRWKLPSSRSKLPSGQIPVHCAREADIATKEASLGFWLAFAEGNPPNFAGINLGQVQIFLEQGTPSPEGCAVYFVVNDADNLHQLHRSSGVQIVETLGDRAYRLRDYTVRDPYGYRLTFGHRLQAAHNSPDADQLSPLT